MNKIIITDLMLYAIVGVYAHEQITTQKISIDLSFSVDLERAARIDELSDTQDYAVICEAMTHFVQRTRCRLIETLAYRLREYLIAEFQLIDLEVQISKWPTNLGGARVMVCAKEKLDV